MGPVLELIEISKSFRTNWTLRTIRAVDGLSFRVRAGEILGLIGHNGAGKTTTFKLLVGLLRPTGGTLLWDGQRLNWQRPRPALGFSPEQPYFYDHLTVRETLNLYGQLYGMPAAVRRQRIDELAAEFGIVDKLSAPMRTLSKGMLQRVAVAQAILHRPRLVILDEPMSGLDPAGRKDMRDRILSLKRAGTAVLFSSHILSDAEALCDRVAILIQGRLREMVNLAQEFEEPASYTLVLEAASRPVLEALSRLALQPLAEAARPCKVKVKNQAALRSALAALHGTDARIEAVLPERPSLEQRFLRYVPGGSDAE
jgi:ABC-2 type transport system ATP-binding protein